MPARGGLKPGEKHKAAAGAFPRRPSQPAPLLQEGALLGPCRSRPRPRPSSCSGPARPRSGGSCAARPVAAAARESERLRHNFIEAKTRSSRDKSGHTALAEALGAPRAARAPRQLPPRPRSRPEAGTERVSNRAGRAIFGPAPAPAPAGAAQRSAPASGLPLPAAPAAAAAHESSTLRKAGLEGAREAGISPGCCRRRERGSPAAWSAVRPQPGRSGGPGGGAEAAVRSRAWAAVGWAHSSWLTSQGAPRPSACFSASLARSCSVSCSLLGMEFFLGRPLGLVGDSRPPPCSTCQGRGKAESAAAGGRGPEPRPAAPAHAAGRPPSTSQPVWAYPAATSPPGPRALTIFFHFMRRFWYQVFTCSWLRPRDSARSILHGERRHGP